MPVVHVAKWHLISASPHTHTHTTYQRDWNILPQSVLSEVQMTLKVVLKCSSKTNGGPFVTTTGTATTPEWCAGSWDYQQRELGLYPLLTLVGEKDRSCWTMCSVLGKRRTSLTAPTTACLFTTVRTTRTQVSAVKVSKSSTGTSCV